MKSDGVILAALQQEFPECEWVAEHKFHDVRKWRFDFACIEKKVAVEINGFTYGSGRHNHPGSVLSDYEKLNTAASYGWRVLQFTPITTGNRLSRFGTDECFKLIRDTLATV